MWECRSVLRRVILLSENEEIAVGACEVTQTGETVPIPVHGNSLVHAYVEGTLHMGGEHNHPGNGVDFTPFNGEMIGEGLVDGGFLERDEGDFGGRGWRMTTTGTVPLALILANDKNKGDLALIEKAIAELRICCDELKMETEISGLRDYPASGRSNLDAAVCGALVEGEAGLCGHPGQGPCEAEFEGDCDHAGVLDADRWLELGVGLTASTRSIVHLNKFFGR